MTNRPLASRGGPETTKLAHHFNLHEYIWPPLLGTDRDKWATVADWIDRAGSHAHQRCGTFDGAKNVSAGPYLGYHAEHHRNVIRLALIDLLETGIPEFIKTRK